MTTKTLAEWLDGVEENHYHRVYRGATLLTKETCEQCRPIAGLRAFDEMHGIEMVLDYDSANLERADYPQCATCQEGVYPCPTRVKIETALGL